jgi:hypothetical protein
MYLDADKWSVPDAGVTDMSRLPPPRAQLNAVAGFRASLAAAPAPSAAPAAEAQLAAARSRWASRFRTRVAAMSAALSLSPEDANEHLPPPPTDDD